MTEAFRHEYDPSSVNAQALYKDIEGFLGEYRFALPRYNYQLLFSRRGEDGLQLRDVDNEESMAKKAARAISRRQTHGEHTFREEAELEGITTLEKKLQGTRDGDLVVWTSPPGPKEDGYGDYGFVYVGEVTSYGDRGDEKHLAMQAIRVENPTLNQFNDFLSDVNKRQTSHQSGEDFLANPYVADGSLIDIDSALRKNFQINFSLKEEEIFHKSMDILNPHIADFISLVKRGTPKQWLRQSFDAIQNYALELKERHEAPFGYYQHEPDISFHQMLVDYNYKPKAIVGSCGPSTSDLESDPFGKTSNIFTKYSSLEELLSTEKDEVFECPSCHAVSTVPVGHQCPSCKITMEEWAAKGNAVCA